MIDINIIIIRMMVIVKKGIKLLVLAFKLQLYSSLVVIKLIHFKNKNHIMTPI